MCTEIKFKLGTESESIKNLTTEIERAFPNFSFEKSVFIIDLLPVVGRYQGFYCSPASFNRSFGNAKARIAITKRQGEWTREDLSSYHKARRRGTKELKLNSKNQGDFLSIKFCEKTFI